MHCKRAYADGVRRLGLLDFRTDAISEQVREIRKLLSARQGRADIMSGEAIIDFSPRSSNHEFQIRLPTSLAAMIRSANWSMTFFPDVAATISARAGHGRDRQKRALPPWWVTGSRPPFPMTASFWIELKGTRSDAMVTASAALGRLIHCLDLIAHLPDSLEERQTLLRSLMRDRKCLVILDDARDSGAHLPPLMPPAPSAALITSRRAFQISACMRSNYRSWV